MVLGGEATACLFQHLAVQASAATVRVVRAVPLLGRKWKGAVVSITTTKFRFLTVSLRQ